MKSKLVLLALLAIGGLSCGQDMDYAQEFPTTTIQSTAMMKPLPPSFKQSEIESKTVLNNDVPRLSYPTLDTTTTTVTTVPIPTVTTSPPTSIQTDSVESTSNEPAVAYSSDSGTYGDPYFIGSWEMLADCESNNTWDINTGNGYYGGLQFNLEAWEIAGGSGYPNEHSKEEQIKRGIRLYEIMGGWQPWPKCTSDFGWR